MDFDEILSCVAPRSLLVVAPKQDLNHSLGFVRKMTSTASAIYAQKQAEEKLTLKEPDTYNHFPDSLQQIVADWISEK